MTEIHSATVEFGLLNVLSLRASEIAMRRVPDSSCHRPALSRCSSGSSYRCPSPSVSTWGEAGLTAVSLS